MQVKKSGKSEENNAVEEAPKSSKRGARKKKVDERENVVYHSLIEKIEYINEREPVTEIDSENPAESRETSDKPKPKKAKKSASLANFIPVITREVKDMVSLDR